MSDGDTPAVLQALSLHHVGIVVADLDGAIEHYVRVLGAHLELRKLLHEQGVDAASLQVGGQVVELIAPLTPESGVGRFLERRGPGLHHVAYGVDDVARALEALAGAEVRLIDREPRIGLHGTPVAFVHPAGMFGVLTELVEINSEGTEADG